MKGFNKLVVCFTDSGDKVILEKKLTDLPIREEEIIKKSIEFFCDPAPCMIHRSAVMKRIFAEIDETFSSLNKPDGVSLQWDELPYHISQYLNISGDIRQVSVKDGC